MRGLLASLLLLLLGLAAACGSTEESAPTPTASPRVSPSPVFSPTPAGTVAPDSGTGGSHLWESGVYIALGDSLSAGVSASDPSTTAFVPLVDEGLGPGIDLMNLGHSGDTSRDLLEHGHLDEAVAEITERNADADPGNDVVLVTLEIGGNDLLDLLFDLVITGECPTLEKSLETPECTERLESAIEGVGPNLRETLARLQEADPDVTIVLLTLPNPFSGGIITIDQLGQMAIEGLPETPFSQGVNDIIRAAAAETGVLLVDIHPLFEGKAPEYISRDFIHPNDTGYRVMADAVLEALGE